MGSLVGAPNTEGPSIARLSGRPLTGLSLIRRPLLGVSLTGNPLPRTCVKKCPFSLLLLKIPNFNLDFNGLQHSLQ